MKPAKPLWGFGCVGWCLLPIAIALAWVWWTGYDLRYQLLWAINESLGTWAMMYLVSNWFSWQCLDLSLPQFGPIALLYVLLAMHLHPSRFSWRWYVFLTCWVLIRPCLAPWMVQVGRPLGVWWNGSFGAGGSHLGWAMPLSWTICAAADVAILWLLTRSRVVLTAAVIVGSIYAALAWQPVITGSFSNDWSGWLGLRYLWSAAIGGALMWWAISARRSVRLPHECQACGYDMRGSPPERCPECGATSPALPTEHAASVA